MRRMLTCDVHATGKDFETFGSDEFLNSNQKVLVPLVVDDDAVPIPLAPFKWGGQCRIEIHLEAIATDKNMVNVFGFTAFFEGSSEDTPDEKDREILNFLVPKTTGAIPQPTVIAVHMQSGDDLADVTFTMTNTIIEEE